MINGILGFNSGILGLNSGNDQVDADTDDRWGISVYVHRRDKLDQRQTQLMQRSQEISQEEDAAIAAFKSTFDDIQKNIGNHKAAILELEVISYVFQVADMQLYMDFLYDGTWRS